MSSFGGVQVDLYLRDETSPAVTDQQRRVRSRLEDRLGAADIAVEEHSKRVPADGDHALSSKYEDGAPGRTIRSLAVAVLPAPGVLRPDAPAGPGDGDTAGPVAHRLQAIRPPGDVPAR